MFRGISGYVVRSDTGRPVSGATIWALPYDADGDAQLYARARRSTSAAGWFELDGLAQGPWRILAQGPAGGRGEVVVAVFDNAMSEVTISLDGLQRWLADTMAEMPCDDDDVSSGGPDGTEDRTSVVDLDRYGPPRGPVRIGALRGRVVQRANGRPVPDAAISIQGEAGSLPDIAPLTDRDGRFAMDGIPWGDWRITATDSRGRRGDAWVRITREQPEEVKIRLG